jgi:hypothetical protein
MDEFLLSKTPCVLSPTRSDTLGALVRGLSCCDSPDSLTKRRIRFEITSVTDTPSDYSDDGDEDDGSEFETDEEEEDDELREMHSKTSSSGGSTASNGGGSCSAAENDRGLVGSQSMVCCPVAPRQQATCLVATAQNAKDVRYIIQKRFLSKKKKKRKEKGSSRWSDQKCCRTECVALKTSFQTRLI